MADQDGFHIAFESRKTAVMLPVGPTELRIEGPGTNLEDEVVGIGAVNVLRRPGLRRVVIDAFFPSTENSEMPYMLATGRYRDPQYYVNFFAAIRDRKEACNFAVIRKNSRGSVKTVFSMPVSIEQFDHGYDAQDLDLHYMLDLKEYRKFASKVVKLS